MPVPTLIGFDLHHVLARPNYFEMLWIAITFSTWKEKFWFFLHALNPFFWWELFTLYRERRIPERITRKLSVKYPSLEPLRMIELIEKISNGQKPHLETWNIVYQLKEQGHVICLTSNITTYYLQELRTKWMIERENEGDNKEMKHLPDDLFTLFDFCFTSDPIDDFERKPSISYFGRWLKTINETIDETRREAIFFIDDSKRNIAAATSTESVNGIHYTSHSDLFWELQNNNLLP